MADKSHLFQKGNPGKPKGATSEFKSTVKEAVLDAFHKLQEGEETNLAAWGKDNLTEFYKIAAKLIPTEVKATVETERVVVNLIAPDVPKAD